MHHRQCIKTEESTRGARVETKLVQRTHLEPHDRMARGCEEQRLRGEGYALSRRVERCRRWDGPLQRDWSSALRHTIRRDAAAEVERGVECALLRFLGAAENGTSNRCGAVLELRKLRGETIAGDSKRRRERERERVSTAVLGNRLSTALSRNA